jgi:tetratricopeptide (TPR) repeat protein
VEGSVQRVSDQVRINVQLIDPRTDTHAWAQQYQRDLSAENVFAIQSEITKKVAQALRIQLSPEEAERVERRPTDDLTAYRFYVQGRRKLDTRRPQAMREGLDFFRRALRKDSTYALAWSGLADAVALSDNYGYEVPASAPPAIDAARRALALDSTLAEAHASLGLVYIVERQAPPAALRELKRAVALRPSYAQARHWLGELLLLLGQPTQAREHASVAVDLNPENADARRVLLDAQLATGDAETALTTARQGQRRHPDYDGSASYLGWRYREFVALVHLQRYDEAQTVAQKASAASTGGTAERWRVYRALVRSRTGTDTPARNQLRRLRNASGNSLTVFHIGLLQAALGNEERAFRAFERVGEWVEGYKTETLRYHYPYILGPLRSDARYEALLRTVNEQWGLQPDGRPSAGTGTAPER